MKISAIIAEYNPLHLGHKYHIMETRRKTGCDKVIAIMSGNFTQRGEPAVFDKWARTRMALLTGIDLVIELPVCYAASSAERFAGGAVRRLDALGCVDTLSFGSEYADLSALENIAHALSEESPAYRAQLSDELQKGKSFPAARNAALSHFLPDTPTGLLSAPNTILAVEYLKALRRQRSAIRPFAIRRDSDYHADALREAMPSALAVRNALRKGDASALSALPKEIAFLCAHPVFPEKLFLPVLYALRSASPEQLSEIYGVSEGLEYKLSSAAKTTGDWETLIQSVKSKRYTRTRISRILLACFLGITKDLQAGIDASPAYARVLGVRKDSLPLLSKLTESSGIPVITQPKGYEENPSLALDIRASDLYGVLAAPVLPSGRDYTEGIIIQE